MSEERDAALARIFSGSRDVVCLGLDAVPAPLVGRARLEGLGGATETPMVGHLADGIFAQPKEGTPLDALARALRQRVGVQAPVVISASTHRPKATGLRRLFGSLGRGPAFELEAVCEALLHAHLSDLRAEALPDGRSLIWALS